MPILATDLIQELQELEAAGKARKEFNSNKSTISYLIEDFNKNCLEVKLSASNQSDHQINIDFLFHTRDKLMIKDFKSAYSFILDNK